MHRFEPDPGTRPPDVVQAFLRGQNLEQMRRTEEAVELYELAVGAAFDAAGPYDRLISIYRAHGAHGEVLRVAEAALDNVRTFEGKREFYERMRDGARQALDVRPDHTGPEF